MKFVLTLACLVFLTACGESEDRTTYGNLKAAVTANQEKWQSLGVKDYAYHLKKSCFCDMTDYLINVRQGNIDTVLSNPDSDDAKTVAANSNSEIMTIDQLFALSLEWADRRPDQLDVAFDPTYFVVTRMFIDHREGTADDEAGITLSGFSEVLD